MVMVQSQEGEDEVDLNFNLPLHLLLSPHSIPNQSLRWERRYRRFIPQSPRWRLGQRTRS